MGHVLVVLAIHSQSRRRSERGERNYQVRVRERMVQVREIRENDSGKRVREKEENERTFQVREG